MTCDQQRFERDVADHVMTIVRDDGIDRHIKFREPGNSCYWFEILTWPGALCIRGDCGTYVFSRLPDMFEFFRERGKDPSKLYINPGYWCEKLQAVDCNGYGKGDAKRFSAERFRERVKERVEQYLEDKEISADRIAELWETIDGEVLDHVYDGAGQVAFHYLYQFHDSDFPRLFEDCCEWNCDEYEFGFMWNLYAIAWAIRQYDADKVAQSAEAA
jgi:hypothetical protein